ncbi:hypothetical protein [Okeania sp. SIO2B3]|uniref:hypothetical protein n=1 Tax=Okeania sp. SIO2B3 TaxID=2607784 RepID=UPI0013C270CD|nr:hypothetical protein [Okeania sp. SIO2B3]NET41796.1 hypothetical protein [Okeania sp. SIO2B3]
MLEINFQQIRPYNGGLREAFEELCCQIFHRLPNISDRNFQLPKDSQFQRFRGAGGDGGVEAIWILPKGDKWGLQAKYFDKLEKAQFDQMEDSLKTAVKNHPELTQYIFCISFNFTGRTGRGKGKIDTLEEWKKKQLQQLASNNIYLSIEFWSESVLRDYLLAVDSGGGLRRYWFDREVMTNNWLQQRLNDAEVQAGQRYSPQLSVNVRAFDALNAFTYQDSWKEKNERYFEEFTDNFQRWDSHVKVDNDLSENSSRIVKNITHQLIYLKDVLSKDCQSYIDAKKVSSQVYSLVENTRKTEKIFLNALLEKHGKNADTPGFRQFEAEYNCHFPAAKLDTTRDLLKCLKKIFEWINTQEFLLPRSQFMLLRGCAGVGKTHAIVDHALHIHKKEQICLIFYGEDFTGDEPWKIIINKLGFSGNISRDELWGMIDAAAEATEKSAIIYIDALNESPERGRWKISWLAPLVQQITNFPRLKLCVSCRDTYLDEVFDESQKNKFIEFEHNGFFGREFDAIKQFFEFYQLDPPATPLLQSEFTNPLFLHLICQAIQGLESRSIPLGSVGFTDILRLLLEEKNQRIAEICRYDKRDENVTQAVNALATKMAESKTRLLSRETAEEIVNQIFFVNDSDRSLFIQLEKEGLIALIEQRSRPIAPKQWFCRFTFERVADFLIALFFLEGIESYQPNSTNPNTIQSVNKLRDIIIPDAFDENFSQNKGLLEAFSIILPEKFQVELTDVIQNENIDRYNFLLPIISSGFQWRAIKTFSEKTKELIIEGLSNSNSCPTILDAIFGIAVIPNHPLNAEFIDELLNQHSLTSRDPFWSALLQEDFEKKGGAWRLIEWSLQADLSSFSQETSRLWAIFLSWCCAASDRRVRDRATKGLTRLFMSHSSIIKITLVRFFDIDDDYVLERVSLATYSGILLLDNNDLLRDVANTIYTQVFDLEKIPENALIRDWLRLIIELAYSRNLLSDTIDASKFRPPYNSQFIEIPSEEDIAHLRKKDAFKGNMKLAGTDFARYVLEGRVLSHYYSVENLEIGQDIFQENMNLNELFFDTLVKNLEIEQDISQENMNLNELFLDTLTETDFASSMLESHVIYNDDSVENPRIEQQEIHRWFIKSVSELGYPGLNEKCYKYDLSLLRKYGSGRGRQTWAERLGKKYYWILLQRLAGILADHLPRKINSWENETSLPRLQGIDIRDIDSTDLRAFLSKSKVNTEWYKPVDYSFDKVSDLNDSKWIELQDFPNIEQIIQTTDNRGEKWLHLSLNSSLKKVVSNQTNAKYPCRDLVTIIRTVFVPFSDIEAIKKELYSTKFYPDLQLPNDYKLLMGEYPNTIASQQRFETGEISLKYNLPGTDHAEFTTIELLRGNDWEYDCSQEESIPSLNVPVPDLVNFGNLKWNTKSSWIDEGKVVQITEVSTESDFGLLIKSNYLKQFIKTSSLAIVFIGFQQKLVSSEPFSIPSVHEIRTVSIFDKDNIINIYNMNRIGNN